MIHENNFKYLSPPTIEQIEAAVKAANVTIPQFERFHNIYPGCIRQIRFGSKQMPPQHWHLFFETSAVSKNVPEMTPKSAEIRTIDDNTIEGERMGFFG